MALFMPTLSIKKKAMSAILPKTIILWIIQLTAISIFSQKEASSIYRTSCGEYNLNPLFSLEKSEPHETRVFVEQASLHCSPNSSSDILDTLPFNASVFATDRIRISEMDTLYSTEVATGKRTAIDIFANEKEVWILVEYQGKSGYLINTDLAAYYQYYPNFLAGFIGKGNETQMVLRSFDEAEPNNIIQSYSCQMYFSAFEVRNQLYKGLDNPGDIVCYSTYTQSCPSTLYNEYISLHNGQFRFITSDISSGESNLYEIETTYFPLKFGNGTILLVANGDAEHIFNFQSATLNTYNYPPQIGIPIEQLVVKTGEYSEQILDNNGEPMMDENENYKVKIVKGQPMYYQWDGQNLVKVNIKK